MVLVSFGFPCRSQQSGVAPGEVYNALCQQWHYAFSVVDAKKIRQLSDLQMTFAKDLTYVAKDNRVTAKGYWCYNNEQNNIELRTAESREVIWGVLVSKEELILVKQGEFDPGSREMPRRYSIYLLDTMNKGKPRGLTGK